MVAGIDDEMPAGVASAGGHVEELDVIGVAAPCFVSDDYAGDRASTAFAASTTKDIPVMALSLPPAALPLRPLG